MSKTREATSDAVKRGMWRSRWAAIGAAIAVSLGAGGLFVAQAAPGPSESTIVTVTPERILDTRDPNNVGLDGPFESAVSQKLKVTGSIPTATGTKTVVPTGATGVLLNVTPVNPTAAGFISIRPGDATGAATTSSLNFTTGVAGIVPNAVQVAVPTAGANAGHIDITYDAYGQTGPTTDILIDVVGYMTSAGLQELVADVATKANAADVYTKAQVDSGFVAQGEIVMSHGTSEIAPYSSDPAVLSHFGTGSDIGVGSAVLGFEGPLELGGVQYGLKSIEYCLRSGAVSSVIVYGQAPSFIGALASDTTDRSTPGCYPLNVNDSSAVAYGFVIEVTSTATLSGFTSTWAPASSLAASALTSAPTSGNVSPQDSAG